MRNHNLYKDGFCFLPAVFSKNQAHSARDGLWEVINGHYETGRSPESRFWNIGDDPASIIKIDKPHLCNRIVWNLVANADLGKELARVTNANMIQVWHSQVVWKPKSKKDSGNAGWHRDAQYWPFWSTEGLYTAWIALSNVTIESGPVRFIVGSNHWATIDGLDFFNKGIQSQDRVLDQSHSNRETVDALLDIGEVSVHSSLTYHSSNANRNQEPRVGMVVHFCTDDAKRIMVTGDNSDYLDQIKNPTIAPVIYQG